MQTFLDIDELVMIMLEASYPLDAKHFTLTCKRYSSLMPIYKRSKYISRYANYSENLHALGDVFRLKHGIRYELLARYGHTRLLNSKLCDIKSCMLEAASQGHLSTVRHLIDLGALINDGIIIAACKAGHHNVVKYLVARFRLDLIRILGSSVMTIDAKHKEMILFVASKYKRGSTIVCSCLCVCNLLISRGLRTMICNLNICSDCKPHDIESYKHLVDCGTVMSALRSNNLDVLRYLIGLERISGHRGTKELEGVFNCCFDNIYSLDAIRIIAKISTKHVTTRLIHMSMAYDDLELIDMLMMKDNYKVQCKSLIYRYLPTVQAVKHLASIMSDHDVGVAFDLACSHNDFDLINLLSDRCIEPQYIYHSMFSACSKGHIEVVKYLMSRFDLSLILPYKSKVVEVLKCTTDYDTFQLVAEVSGQDILEAKSPFNAHIYRSMDRQMMRSNM